MKKIFPTIGASLMLVASVLTFDSGARLVSYEAVGPDPQVPADVNEIDETGQDENGDSSHMKYLEGYESESGGRIIIYDNDFVVPRHEKQLMPMKN